MGGAPNGDPVGLTMYFQDPALPAGHQDPLHSHHEQPAPATSESSPEHWLCLCLCTEAGGREVVSKLQTYNGHNQGPLVAQTSTLSGVQLSSSCYVASAGPLPAGRVHKLWPTVEP